MKYILTIAALPLFATVAFSAPKDECQRYSGNWNGAPIYACPVNVTGNQGGAVPYTPPPKKCEEEHEPKA